MEILSAVEKEERGRLRLRAHEQVMRRAAEYGAEQLTKSGSFVPLQDFEWLLLQAR